MDDNHQIRASVGVTYLHFQDDFIILCRTKRQMNRCRRKLMSILQERHLRLSRKKSRIGSTDKDFHFLGIHYPGTQTRDDTKVVPAETQSTDTPPDSILVTSGGALCAQTQSIPAGRMIPHSRTLRKARLQVKLMVDTSDKQRLLPAATLLRTERAIFTALRSSSHKAIQFSARQIEFCWRIPSWCYVLPFVEQSTADI